METNDRELLALFDTAPLTPRFWATVVLVYAQAAFEFFDYFLVGYLVAVLAQPWHLTCWHHSKHRKCQRGVQSWTHC